MDPGEAAGTEPLGQFLGTGLGRKFNRKGQDQARVVLGFSQTRKCGVNCLGRIVLHRQGRVLIKQASGPGKKKLEMVVKLGHRAHGGPAGAHRVGLVDGDCRGYAFDFVHRRFVHAVQKLARIGGKGFDVAPLALGVQRVKHQTRLARATRAGDDRQLTGADVEVEVLEIVLPRPANADGALGHSECSLEWGAAF